MALQFESKTASISQVVEHQIDDERTLEISYETMSFGKVQLLKVRGRHHPNGEFHRSKTNKPTYGAVGGQSWKLQELADYCGQEAADIFGAEVLALLEPDNVIKLMLAALNYPVKLATKRDFIDFYVPRVPVPA